MRGRSGYTAVAVAIAVIAAAIGGTAAAAGSSTGNSFLDDFAQHLGVSPAKVQSAYDQTVVDRLNALVKAGKLTKQQAQAIQQHLKDHPGGLLDGDGFGFGLPPALGPHAGLAPRPASASALPASSAATVARLVS